MNSETKTKDIILPDDPRAAVLKTLELWVTPNGKCYSKDDEKIARYAGATHVYCDNCGAPCEKPYCCCEKCSYEHKMERYRAKEKKMWDGETPLFSEYANEYFYDEEAVEDYARDEGITLEEMRLLICKPCYLPEIDPCDYAYEQLPEDGELPQAALEAIDQFNNAISKIENVSWVPGKFAAEL